MTILDQLAAYARERVEQDKQKISPEEIKDLAKEKGRGNGKLFYDAMSSPGTSFICEIKKASPSKGLIDPEFDYMKIAAEYAAAGTDAISCLTEPKWFMGSDEIFRNVRSAVTVPMLRKDFTVDEYQIYQARLLDADCVLLICALMDTKILGRYLELCEEIGLAALVETHDDKEICSAVRAGARMIGVNNRNLKDFSVDLGNVSRLRDLIPPECLYIAESGVQTSEDAKTLSEAGADAVLVGEAMMRTGNKTAFLHAMRGIL